MKGDFSACKNYLGMILLPVPGKVLNRILLAYLKDVVGKKLWDNQAGLKREISCTDQIAILLIIELQMYSYQLNDTAHFISIL